MKKLFIQVLATFLIFMLSTISLPAQTNNSQAGNDTSLYIRLGGADTIDALLNSAITYIIVDSRINIRFSKSDVKTLNANWNNTICNKTGGKCDLPTFSEKFNASDTEWEAGIEDIEKALNGFKVKEPEQLELIAILNALRKGFFKQ